MRKRTGIGLVLLVAALMGSLAIPGLADCGKMIIVTHRWSRPPRPPRRPIYDAPPHWRIPPKPRWQVPDYGQGRQQQQQQQEAISNAVGNMMNVNINADNGTGSVPPPPPIESGGAVAYGDKAFMEGQQQAVVAWNGKADASGEEILILTTNEVSNTGQPMAMLSVLPLPGRPISIDRASAQTFVKSKILLDKKIAAANPNAGQGIGYGVIMTQKIGSHNIFVWEMEDIGTFKDEVSAYVAQKYNNGATALITDKTLQIVKGYHDRGFRYFAFDLTLVDKTASTKEAIAYRFHSTFAYYPLAISGIGGTGHGIIDLVVMTPGAINLRGAFEQGREEASIIVKGRTGSFSGTVDFSMDEVREIEPKLAEVFRSGGQHSVRVRNFLIEAEDIGQFKSDFIATPAGN